MSTPSRTATGGQPWRSALVRDSWGVGVATGVYGISFGAISVAAGLSVLQTCVLSLVMFTGASQFAFVGVIAAGASPWSAVLTGTLLGTRNTLYGLKLAPTLQLRGPRRWLGAHLVIDESTAMSVTRDTLQEARTGFWHTGGSVFLLWNLATLAGAVAGNRIGDPRDFGLDAAVGAAFLALLWPRLTSRTNQALGLLAAAVALALAPVTGAGVPVLAAGGVALLAGLLRPARAGDQGDQGAGR